MHFELNGHWGTGVQAEGSGASAAQGAPEAAGVGVAKIRLLHTTTEQGLVFGDGLGEVVAGLGVTVAAGVARAAGEAGAAGVAATTAGL